MSEEKKFSLRDTIIPKSDQLNYDDFVTGPLTVRVVGLAAGSAEQPVMVRIVESATGTPRRDFKPCKTMRRVLIAAWGDKGKAWIGKEMTLYGDGKVKFGGDEVGGIRISHMSGIADTLRLKVTTARSKRTEYVVKVLASTAATGQTTPKPADVEPDQTGNAADTEEPLPFTAE